MNICVLNSAKQGGGAEAISRALYEGMQQFDDCNVFFVSGGGSLEEENVIFPNAKAKDIRNLRLKLKMLYRKNVFLYLTHGEIRHEGYALRWLINFIKENQIDILHIGNLHMNWLGIKDVRTLTRYCKVVWTMHDMWLMTGHCVYAFDCEQWEKGSCSNCPRVEIMCAVRDRQTARRSLEDKKKYLCGCGITYVAISEWMKNNFQNSILKNEHMCLIKNGINTELFNERDRKDIRKKLGIKDEEFTVLFVANGVESPFKGIDVLLQALKCIAEHDRKNVTLLICGAISDASIFGLLANYRILTVGYIHDNNKMAEMYSAADIFIAPSKAEAFSLVVVESMACGTPVIGSDAGGIPELITKETGWVFDNGDSNALAKLICEAKEAFYTGKLDRMRTLCSERALNYDIKTFIENYKALYESLLEE